MQSYFNMSKDKRLNVTHYESEVRARKLGYNWDRFLPPPTMFCGTIINNSTYIYTNFILIQRKKKLVSTYL